jgi:CRISPR-associated endonuclease Csn1
MATTQPAAPNASPTNLPNAPHQPWSLGLDIGIASVGWAVLGRTRIIDLGVRCFDKAETPKEGESLNLARRTARLMRRRLFRRAWRLTKLARLMRREGLIENADFFKSQPSFNDSAWQLRVAGLDHLLSPLEWARVMYHLCKHRGFHWVSRADEVQRDGDAKDEKGRVKKGLAGTAALMQSKGYRTVAEMVLQEFPDAQRNKRGEYTKALSRRHLDDEFRQLFEAQRRLGNTHASETLEIAVRGSGDLKSGLFAKQKPSLAGEDLLKMLGKCTFEKTEFRAPKAAFTAERQVWLTRLNNMRVVVDGTARPLTEEERAFALLLPYEAADNYKYKTFRKAMVKANLLPESFRFASLAYPSASQIEEAKAKDPEDATVVKLLAWHELRLLFSRAKLTTEWQQISTAALEGNPELLDQIAWVLSVYKEDDEVAEQLRRLNLPNQGSVIDVLVGIRFDKFHALSLKALRQIVPHMAKGLRYDEAVAAVPAYGHHSQRVVLGTGLQLFLPSFYDNRDARGAMKFREGLDVPRNPVVLRSLNQARKVVNALIKKYGSPSDVHIEMARDLSRPLDERTAIKKLQDEFRDRNDKARASFQEDHGYVPKGAVFERWMLYREQHGQCAYSQRPLDLDHVLNDPSYAQIDHALPYSRSYDDSKNNKVLVHSAENQNKGNRTAYEYLTSFTGGEEGERWRNFQAWVNTNKAYRAAKRNRLLRKNYGPEEAAGFKDRNLNDTRYICKFFKNFVEANLLLASDSDTPAAKRCVVVNGQLTAFLRARWGLTKNRAESDRHHALDAVVVAACSHAMVQSLAAYAKRKELEFLRSGFVDPETGVTLDPKAHAALGVHFPAPWSNFREELLARLLLDDPALMRAELVKLASYDDAAIASVRPLFVSRAPQRRNSGSVHKETIYRLAENGATGVVARVSLSKLKMGDLDNLVDPHRNEKLYAAIRARLEAHGGKADKAFTADNPLYKPGKDGAPAGPIVRAVQVRDESFTGVAIREGAALNERMVRLDLFEKGGRFFVVPVYEHHRVSGLPNRAVVAHKSEREWTIIDNTFQFLFSIYSNDLLVITLKNVKHVGYFSGCDRAGGTIKIWAPDSSTSVGTQGLVSGIGIKTALSVVKLHVDVLGITHNPAAEKRLGLA